MRRGWLRAAATGLAAVAALTLLAACGDDDTGSPGVAAVDTTAGSDDGSSGATEPVAEPDPVAYSRCMRDNGVSGFPDPNSNGEHAISDEQLGVSIDSDVYTRADEACAHLMPQRSADQQQQDYEARLDYAQCMRDEGITGFPDPPAPGDGATQSNSSGGAQSDVGFDPESAQFQAAHDACADLAPEGAAGPSLSEGPGQ